jgi:hypothetical protein
VIKEILLNSGIFKAFTHIHLMGWNLHCRQGGCKRCGTVFRGILQILYCLDFPLFVYLQIRGQPAGSTKETNHPGFTFGDHRGIFIQCFLF